MSSEVALKAAEKSFLSMPGFIADLFPGNGEQWIQFHLTYVACEAEIIDEAADEKYADARKLAEMVLATVTLAVSDDKIVALAAHDWSAFRDLAHKVVLGTP